MINEYIVQNTKCVIKSIIEFQDEEDDNCRYIITIDKDAAIDKIQEDLDIMFGGAVNKFMVVRENNKQSLEKNTYYLSSPKKNIIFKES